MEKILIEYKDGKLHTVLDVKKDTFYLVPKKSNSYTAILEEKLKNYQRDMQYIKVDLNNNEIYIKCSWYGEYPLFYYVSNNIVLIDYNLTRIIKRLKQLGREVKIDRIAFYQMLILDNPLRNRTLFKNVSKCIAGEEIKIDLSDVKAVREKIWCLPFNTTGYEKSEDEYLEQAKYILSNLLNPFLTQLSKAERVLIPLSGGYDSRLLVSLAKSRGIDFKSLVFGPKHSNEVKVAKVVASNLDLNLTYYELLNSYYIKYGKEVVDITGGLSSAMHCHLYSVLKQNNLTPTYIIHGYMGDVYAGDSQPLFANEMSMTKEEAINKFMKRIKGHTVWEKMNFEEKEEFKHDLYKIMDDCCTVNFPCHFDEYVHNVDRQFSLISNVFAPVELFSTMIRPFASKEYALFFNTLPYELRKNRYLYVKAAKELFPDVFSIPNQRIPIGFKNIKKIYPNIRKVFLGAFVISYLLTRGKFKIGRSMVYENHHELLDNELLQILNKSIKHAYDVLGIDFSEYQNMSFTRFKETSTPFRLISFYWLKDYFLNP